MSVKRVIIHKSFTFLLHFASDKVVLVHFMELFLGLRLQLRARHFLSAGRMMEDIIVVMKIDHSCSDGKPRWRPAEKTRESGRASLME